jgi:hypothetical protein
MATLTCPHCDGQISIKALVDTPKKVRPQQNGQITPLSTGALRDIFDTLHRFGPGAMRTVPELYRVYIEIATQKARTKFLTKYAFTLGLKRYGLERWRASGVRGYTLPDPLPTEPLTITDAARERRDAEDYRGTVATPVAQRPERKIQTREEMLADLPFEIDLPE